MKKLLLTATVAVCMPASASAAQLIVNGGFEAPTVDDPCCITSPPTAIPGWTATPDVNVVNGTFSSNPGGTNLAYEGLQYLDLVGQSGMGSISQTFNTVIGQTYDISFAYSHNLFSGTQGATADFSVGDLIGSLSHSSGSNSDLDWMIFTGSFTATDRSTTLTFTNLTGGPNEGVLLDAVSVQGAVPEPATWALLILGFGVVGGAMRQRSRKTLSLA